MGLSWFGKLKSGLSKTSTDLSSGIKDIFTKRKLDDTACEELEETLILSDMGVNTALKYVEKLRETRFGKDISDEEVRTFIAEEIQKTLLPFEKPFTLPESKPAVIIMVGVNGSGKTTTIGKLTSKFKTDGKKVMVAAGDTFRAGAVEQLGVWAERNKVPIVKPHKEGADPAGVIFKAYEEAEAQGIDILIADTAGRLQNRKELMDELGKIIRVLKKHNEDAPHAVLLVLDATVGQNALSQAEAFTETAGVTGLVINKLDGSAKGGVVVALAEKFGLPVHFIGIGEGIDDLREFNAEGFSKALMGLEE